MDYYPFVPKMDTMTVFAIFAVFRGIGQAVDRLSVIRFKQTKLS